ncbi:MAG: hypothetical protein LBF15_03445 [Candidatus Peribacteria bacterium]|nr:hypothetical protein [Candidatus Peribacteria bacterium]
MTLCQIGFPQLNKSLTKSFQTTATLSRLSKFSFVIFSQNSISTLLIGKKSSVTPRTVAFISFEP